MSAPEFKGIITIPQPEIKPFEHQSHSDLQILNQALEEYGKDRPNPGVQNAIKRLRVEITDAMREIETEWGYKSTCHGFDDEEDDPEDEGIIHDSE